MTSSTAEWDTGEFDQSGRGYPRPQLVRNRWLSRNGAWDFAIDRAGAWTHPRQVEWQTAISVPFAPEAPREGLRLRVSLEGPPGVTSCTALRSIATQRDRIVLNNRPCILRLVLDQGYWPEGGQTAPERGELRAP